MRGPHINTDYLKLFQEFESGLNGKGRGPLHERRIEGIKEFAQTGFPSTGQEDWRFTDVSPIARAQFRNVARADQGALDKNTVRNLVADEKHPRLVFENGHFREDLSQLPQNSGITVKNLLRATGEHPERLEAYAAQLAPVTLNGFVALNTAFMYDGAFIDIADSVVMDSPLYVVYYSTKVDGQAAVFPRNLIILGRHAQATVVEHYVSSDEHRYFNNSVSEIYQDQSSLLNHVKIQHESASAYHTELTHVQQQRNSVYKSHVFSFGSRLARSDIQAQLNGEGAETVLNGLSLSSGRSLVDHHTLIDHAAAHSSSRELYKGILDGKAKAVFSGKIHVRQQAQKTDAKQSNENLLLSQNAVVDTKPQLEIFADDVRCTHGSTVGQMDKDGLFYLRSRGLSLAAARNLMIRAFAGEITEQIQNNQERQALERLVDSKLSKGHLQ
ncbi:MAG: Fe-S cluster assembly protein SufD [candidate division KSB1 bacterium]|nr:Fe-S cluster assembly protein SufD [candidate division KSB1 bacterium]